MTTNIYFRKAIHTEHGAIFLTQPLSAKELKFKEYIDKTYADEAVKVGSDFKERLFEALNNVKNDSYYGVAVISVLNDTKRYVYIKNTDTRGEPCDECDIEIDLLNRTYSAKAFSE